MSPFLGGRSAWASCPSDGFQWTII
jgi:hypothetical protein